MYSIRNIVDGQVVSLLGANDGDGGEFCIGLTVDERVACSSSGEVAGLDSNDGDIVVPLVKFRVWKTSGVTVCPASRDLPCRLNGSDIGLEANVIPGDQIEVGDKVLELVKGTPARTHRRHLPPTPGVPIMPVPPPKPKRSAAQPSAPVNSHNSSDDSHKDSLIDELKEWCVVKLPNSEHELLQNVKDPEELASLASSYLSKHINLHTDIVMTSELANNIFTVLQEVAWHRRDILRKFLGEVISELADNDEDIDAEKKHRSVTSLLVEILRQFLDPGSLVLLCLQLLRALSHIPGNVVTMVNSQTTAAVLGSMAVYKDDENIQNFCLDILAKMATYIPGIGTKPPMRESSIDLIAMAIVLHNQNLMVVQAAVRTLANLAASLHTLTSSVMIDAPNPDLRRYMDMVMVILDHLYDNTLDKVRDALASFSTDLNVKMDGRRYLFEYAKVDQLRSQRNIWEIQPESPRWQRDQSVDSTDNDFYNEQKADDQVLTKNTLTQEDSLESGIISNEDNEEETGESMGILKKARSFENLRTPERKVYFTQDDNLSPSISPSSSSQGSPSASPIENNEPRTTTPTIEIISRSRICPETLLPIESSNGDLCFFPAQPASDGGPEVPSPTTPAVPPRRPIQAPLVHINSQSDSEGDVFVDSPNHHRLMHGEIPSSKLPNTHPLTSTPLDLTGFRYSTADKSFMKRVMSVQITCHVCSASVKGSNPQSLKLIDMPLKELLHRPGIPVAIFQFAESQLDLESSLMDNDPATVISIIDAVRYKMLAFELIRKSLQMLVQSLSSGLHKKMFTITEEVITSVARDTGISSILQDKNFIASLEEELDSVMEMFKDPSNVVSLKECILKQAHPRGAAEVNHES